jgi:flavin reductase (DIM6/NTAB) family NADH-FMN oxidoreductase RutF
MAAEWTYLVSKEPPQAAVVVSNDALTQEIAIGTGEFSVTLCSAGQAALADFVGSVSGRDIDKTASLLINLCEPLAISTPWVGGGIAALECEIRQIVPLPGYQMLIGEVLATHADGPTPGQPLVKHGAMYALGERLTLPNVVAAAELRGGERPQIRVAAAGQPPDEETPWRVSLVDGGQRAVPLGEVPPNAHGDLLASFDIPESAASWNLSSAEILVEREGIDPGRARISFRNASRMRLLELPRAAAHPDHSHQLPDPGWGPAAMNRLASTGARTYRDPGGRCTP